MPRPVDRAFEDRVRREAITWLTLRTNDGAESLSTSDLADFTVDGEPFRLKDAQQGIRKPRHWTAALSIQTVYRADGQDRPYEDRVGQDGLLRYKWRKHDPNHFANVGLRDAMRQQVPLIWFFGVGVAMWIPIFPIYVLAEEPDQHQFVVDPDVARNLVQTGGVIEENLRRYIVAETRRRLHQPVFRATVMRAYGTRCAVCSLAHGSLLDAAHIVADGQDGGEPIVSNGLALCKFTMLHTTQAFSEFLRSIASRFEPTCCSKSTVPCSDTGSRICTDHVSWWCRPPATSDQTPNDWPSATDASVRAAETTSNINQLLSSSCPRRDRSQPPSHRRVLNRLRTSATASHHAQFDGRSH